MDKYDGCSVSHFSQKKTAQNLVLIDNYEKYKPYSFRKSEKRIKRQRSCHQDSLGEFDHDHGLDC